MYVQMHDICIRILRKHGRASTTIYILRHICVACGRHIVSRLDEMRLEASFRTRTVTGNKNCRQQRKIEHGIMSQGGAARAAA